MKSELAINDKGNNALTTDAQIRDKLIIWNEQMIDDEAEKRIKQSATKRC